MPTCHSAHPVPTYIQTRHHQTGAFRQQRYLRALVPHKQTVTGAQAASWHLDRVQSSCYCTCSYRQEEWGGDAASSQWGLLTGRWASMLQQQWQHTDMRVERNELALRENNLCRIYVVNTVNSREKHRFAEISMQIAHIISCGLGVNILSSTVTKFFERNHNIPQLMWMTAQQTMLTAGAYCSDLVVWPLLHLGWDTKGKIDVAAEIFAKTNSLQV